MALKIGIHTEESNPEPEAEMNLFLSKDPSGPGVFVKAFAANGSDWFIARITPDGLELIPYIPASADWPTDDDGRIKLVVKP